MMGAGKTTVGQILAAQLGYGFVDTDAVIEQLAQKSINQIFAEEGETTFRQIETKVLSEVCAYTRLAIATGGGIVLRRENWGYLHYGLIVWLDVPVEQLYKRLAEDTTRPLLQDPDPIGKLRSLLDERRSLYAEADLHITPNPQDPPDAIAAQVLEAIPSMLKQGLG
jgi:shikimate kinase